MTRPRPRGSRRSSRLRQLVLEAPKGRPWSEVWRLLCSPIWSCSVAGIPPGVRVAEGSSRPSTAPGRASRSPSPAPPAGRRGPDPHDRRREPRGHPRPPPRARPPRRDRAQQPRAAARPAHPGGAEVQQVTVDGQDRPARPEQGELRVTVPAGRHTLQVRWQQSRGCGSSTVCPREPLGAAVNVTQHVTLPPERWLLATRGPAWGPAVLFWPYLVFLLAVALALGRNPREPPHERAVGPARPRPQRAPGACGPDRGGLRVRPRPARQRARFGTLVAFNLVQVCLAAWALVSLGLLYVAIHQGLLFRPDMQVAGGGSTDTLLRWYADRVPGRPRRGRSQPAPLGVPRRDVAVGPVARGGPRARRGPGVARVHRGRPVA